MTRTRQRGSTTEAGRSHDERSNILMPPKEECPYVDRAADELIAMIKYEIAVGTTHRHLSDRRELHTVEEVLLCMAEHGKVIIDMSPGALAR